MSKKFKLVYEEGGMLKGSYSGIPCKDDTNVIERSVLEGSKPVPPAPGPEPEVDNNKSYEEALACLRAIEEAYSEERAAEVKVDKTFNFKDCSFELIHQLFMSVEPEFFIYMLECIESEVLKLDFNISMSLTAERMTDTLFEFDEFKFFSLCHSQLEPPGPSWNPSFGVAIETDAETGDPRIVGNLPDKNFTGSLRIAFDGSKL